MNEKRAVIYHFTKGSANRPIIYLKELERIKQFAAIVGYPDAEVYLDKSLRKKEQVQLQKLLFEMTDYQALIMKDFYHLRKNTGAFMNDLIALGNRGVNVYSLEDGNFKLEQAPFEQSLRVAIYYCGLEIVGRPIELQFQIMLLLSQNIKIERCILILGINIEPDDLADLRKSINRLDVYCAASSG